MKITIAQLINRHTLKASTFSTALLLSFILNFLFNAYLGRVLTFVDFGVITFIGSLWLIIMVFLNALALTINHTLTLIRTHTTEHEASLFLRQLTHKVLVISLIVSVIWLVISPITHLAFALQSTFTVVLLTPLFTIGALVAVNKGHLQYLFKFSQVGVILIAEAIAKLLLALLFVHLQLNALVYLSIPLSVVVSLLVSKAFIVRDNSPGVEKSTYSFPVHFYVASIITILSTTLLFTFDVILAKLFLPAELAGQYAFLSLIGKMIYFFGSLFNTFMVPYVTSSLRQENERKKMLSIFLGVSGVLILGAFVFVGVLGQYTLPILFGSKVKTILSYLFPYSLALSLFTLTNTVVVYNLLLKRYIFPIIALLISFLMIVGIGIFHSNISQFVTVILDLSIFSFILIFILHSHNGFRSSVERRLVFLEKYYER